MRRLAVFFCLAMLCSIIAQAQINIPQTWKFHTGDQSTWSAPGFNDASWETIKVGSPWELQGHTDYDGFAWYRVKVVIPSSLKTNSYLKGDLKIALGKIDDGDETFLNGKIIGQNAELGGSIEEGNWDVSRTYRIPLNDPAIHWDAENVIAVRVYDHSGNGGMYEGPYSVSVAGITDMITIDDRSDNFHFSDRTHMQKKIYLKTSSGQYDFSGNLTVEVIDPADGKSLWQKSVPAHFSQSKPFSYQYAFTSPAGRSYEAKYVFKEHRSGKTVTATEGVPYILTPVPSPKPQINGATVTGVRPGHPFLFRVPATGKRPVQFSAANLPEGLHMDGGTGIISGRVFKPGDYVVKLTVKNALGTDSRDLTIKVGNLIGLTPAMGWNSWNAWGLSVNEQKVKAAADVMVKKGLMDHGWTYINIDDGWQRPTRAADGRVVPNNKFPDMKGLADYIHHDGLKMGIYSSPGTKTCGGFMGSYQHEAQDAETYAQWGIDYLKYDWCSYSQVAPPKPDLAWLQKPYKLMDSALQHIDRDIYYSLCQYGMGDVWKWGTTVNGNSWRTTGDIRDTWQSMAGIGFHQEKCAPYAAPGRWNDPDMLVVGKVGWGPNLHSSRLTPDEQYTHISLWCMLSAPLLIGCDMSQLDDFTLNLLTNDEVLAIDQDPLGKEAVQVAKVDSVLIYEKDLADGTRAVGFFNVGSTSANATVQLSALGLSGTWQVRDLWRQKNVGTAKGTYHAKAVPSHGVLLVKMSKAD
jgi:hypothetical protein